MTHFPTAPIGSITTTEAAEATIVHLAGQVDAALREDASRAMDVMVRRQLPVVLDTTALTFIDSTGLAFLIQCAVTGRASGVAVDLPRPPTQLTDLLDVVGARSLFEPPATHGAAGPPAGRAPDQRAARPVRDVTASGAPASPPRTGRRRSMT